MALSHDKTLLAVGRENNSIEIWSVPDAWSQLIVIPGNKNCDIRNIHWVEPKAKKGQTDNPLYYKSNEKGKEQRKRRLITTGLNGLVIEWDLLTMKPRAKYASHSGIWDSKMHGKYLYLACEDGTIKVVKVKKARIELVKTMVKVDSKCLSLAIDNTTGDVKNIYAGYSDSSIRKWDLQSGNSLLHFQKQTKKAQKAHGECMMWKLALFKQNTLISGDSLGEVSIWDCEFGTHLKTFNNLKGDIMSIEVNESFNSVYASGVDSRVISVQLKETSSTSEWVFSSIFRGQSHDIRSLVLLNSKQLISGGVTTDICIYNL